MSNASSDPVDSAIADAWFEVVGLPPDSVTADFFESGGDSLAALRLMAIVERKTRVTPSLAAFVNDPTPRGLRTQITEPSSSSDSLRWLSDARPGTPFLCIHGADGGDATRRLRKLVELNVFDRPIGTFRPRGLIDDDALPTSVEELAEEYSDAMSRTERSLDRAVIGGFCLGGGFAIELAHRAMRLGIEVPALVLIDTTFPRPMDKPSEEVFHAWRLEELQWDRDGIDVGPASFDLMTALRRRFPDEPTEWTTVAEFDRFQRLWTRLNWLARHHEPRKWPGRSFLFVASEEPAAETLHADASFGRWHDVLSDLTVVPIATTHRAILSSVELGEALEMALRTVDAGVE